MRFLNKSVLFLIILHIKLAYEIECFSCVDVRDKKEKTVDISTYVYWLLPVDYSTSCFDHPNVTKVCQHKRDFCVTMTLRGIQSKNHTLPANQEYLYWLELYDIDSGIVRGCSNEIIKVEKNFVVHPNLKKHEQCIENQHGTGRMKYCSCDEKLCNISNKASKHRHQSETARLSLLFLFLMTMPLFCNDF